MENHKLKMTNQLIFNGSEIIGDILSLMPEAAEILSSHGVSCASCHINAYETLQDGILGHGYDQDDLNSVLADLNECATDMGLTDTSIPKEDPKLTEYAAEKVKEFQTSQEKDGWGFRVEVLDNSGDNSYFLDFEEKPEKNDIIVESQSIKMYLAPDSFRLLQNKTINFVEKEGEEGFKIE